MCSERRRPTVSTLAIYLPVSYGRPMEKGKPLYFRPVVCSFFLLIFLA